MAQSFLRIGRSRYKLSTIKMYESYDREDMAKQYGLKIYFSIPGHQSCMYHMFSTPQSREIYLNELDSLIKDLIVIGDKRYRSSAIKYYETTENHKMDEPYALDVYFAVPRTVNRIIHRFETQEARDSKVLWLDGKLGGV